MGKGQSTSVHAGCDAGAARGCGRSDHANAAASALTSEAATTAMAAILLTAQSLPFPVGLVAGEIRLRRHNLPPLRVGVGGQRHQLLVVLSRGGFVAELFSGPRGTRVGLEAVRLLGLGGLEGSKR